MTPAPELKPCPFCGRLPKFIGDDFSEHPRDHWLSLGCESDECVAHPRVEVGLLDPEAHARAADLWNRRVPAAPRAPAEIGTMVEALLVAQARYIEALCVAPREMDDATRVKGDDRNAARAQLDAAIGELERLAKVPAPPGTGSVAEVTALAAISPNASGVPSPAALRELADELTRSGTIWVACVAGSHSADYLLRRIADALEGKKR